MPENLLESYLCTLDCLQLFRATRVKIISIVKNMVAFFFKHPIYLAGINKF